MKVTVKAFLTKKEVDNLKDTFFRDFNCENHIEIRGRHVCIQMHFNEALPEVVMNLLESGACVDYFGYGGFSDEEDTVIFPQTLYTRFKVADDEQVDIVRFFFNNFDKSNALEIDGYDVRLRMNISGSISDEIRNTIISRELSYLKYGSFEASDVSTLDINFGDNSDYESESCIFTGDDLNFEEVVQDEPADEADAEQVTDVAEDKVEQDTDAVEEDVEDSELEEELAEEGSVEFKELLQIAKESLSYTDFVINVCKWLNVQNRTDTFVQIAKLNMNELNWKDIMKKTSCTSWDKISIPRAIAKKGVDLGYGRVRLKRFFRELFKYRDYPFEENEKVQQISTEFEGLKWLDEIVRNVPRNISFRKKVNEVLDCIGYDIESYAHNARIAVVSMVSDAIEGEEINYELFNENPKAQYDQILGRTVLVEILGSYQKSIGIEEKVDINYFLKSLKWALDRFC